VPRSGGTSRRVRAEATATTVRFGQPSGTSPRSRAGPGADASSARRQRLRTKRTTSPTQSVRKNHLLDYIAEGPCTDVCGPRSPGESCTAEEVNPKKLGQAGPCSQLRRRIEGGSECACRLRQGIQDPCASAGVPEPDAHATTGLGGRSERTGPACLAPRSLINCATRPPHGGPLSESFGRVRRDSRRTDFLATVSQSLPHRRQRTPNAVNARAPPHWSPAA